LATEEDNYKRPLKDIYDGFPESLRMSVNKDAGKIWKYFVLWCFFIILSTMCGVGWISCDLIDESVGKRIQRAGAIIPLFAVFGEAVFLIKLNNLASVIHPAKLLCEIYKERRFKLLKNTSLYITAFFIFLGGILSGYGDLLYKQIAL
jgi:hypothetical protein